MERVVNISRRMAVAGVVLAAQGCVSIQAIEPVIAPPSQFQTDTAVAVEFLPAIQVGLRCAERGAKFLGLPGLNSGACADLFLITMLDPCATLTAGAYAQSLCAARNAAFVAPPRQISEAIVYQISDASFAPPATPPSKHPGKAIRVDFVDPEMLAGICHRQGLRPAGEPHAAYCSGYGKITVANPCSAPNRSWYTRALCHELAHANGWPPDHPGHAHSAALPFARESPEAKALAASRAHAVAGENAR
jgi:hypothetical protein